MTERLIGLVGCGKQGEKHLGALMALGADVACADVDTLAAAKLAGQNGIDHRPLDAILDDPRVAGIVIATPTPTHFDLIGRALRGGKQVLCEKPLVQSVKDAETLLRIERETGRHVLVGFIYRFLPAFERLHVLRRDDALGPLVHACLRIGGRGEHRAWKHDRAGGGGVLNEMAVHMLDAALWLFGEPASCEVLSAATLRPRRVVEGRELAVDAEDYLVARLTAANGAPVLLIADMVTPAFVQYLDAQYDNASALASIDGKFANSLFLKEARAGLASGAQKTDGGGADLYRRQAEAFLRVVATGEAPDRNRLADSIPVLRLVEEIERQISSSKLQRSKATA